MGRKADALRKGIIKMFPGLDYDNCLKEKEETGLALFGSCLGTSPIRCDGCPYFEQKVNGDGQDKEL